MTYEVLTLRRTQKQLAALSLRDYERIRSAILSLGDEPRPRGCLKLSGRDGWRIRIGDYRVIYEINDNLRTVTVLDVGHRRDIYA